MFITQNYYDYTTHIHTKSNSNYRYGLKEAGIGLLVAGLAGCNQLKLEPKIISLEGGITESVVNEVYAKLAGKNSNSPQAIRELRNHLITTCNSKSGENVGLRFDPSSIKDFDPKNFSKLSPAEQANVTDRVYKPNGARLKLPDNCRDQLGKTMEIPSYQVYNQVASMLEVIRRENQTPSIAILGSEILTGKRLTPSK